MATSSDNYELSKTALNEEYEKDIRPVIDLIDDLRRYGVSDYIELPAVVVVGDQSSGKSSILEALSGVELPRGTGIMTRCPLVMEMKHGYSWSASICIAGGVRKDISKPSYVKQSIINAQNEAAGGSRMVSRTEISLSISSPNAPDLTLIDLPGITRLAVDGQPDDMPQQIKRLVHEYIERPNTLILCVISGNLDIAVNESVRLAQECDPRGERTIGVITKPDLIENDDAKRTALLLLNGQIIQLKKGFIMVKCRPVDDSDKYSLMDALEKERDFFSTDKIFRNADKNKVTISSLSHLLTDNLVQIIKKKLPEIRDSISKLRIETQEVLDTMPRAPPSEFEERRGFLIQHLTNFQNALKDCIIKGAVKKIGKSSEGNSFIRWRKSCRTLEESFHELTQKMMETQLSEAFFEEEIVRRQGKAFSTLFVPFEIISDPMKEHIKTYQNPAEICIQSISNSLDEIIGLLIERFFSIMPEIKGIIQEICHTARLNQEKVTSEMIKFHLKEEKVIFTQESLLKAEHDLMNQQQPLQDNEGTLDACNAKRIRRLVEVYVRIMNKRLSDQIPACIFCSLNKELVASLKTKLLVLYQSEDFVDKAGEHIDTALERQRLADKLSCLEEGEKRFISLS